LKRTAAITILFIFIFWEYNAMGGLLLINLQAICRQLFMAIFNGLWVENRSFLQHSIYT